jgi:conserved hypothetical protein
MKLIKVILRITIPLALGILIFWWVYRKMDFGQILDIMSQGIHYEWLIISCLFELLAHIIRAIRWKMLINLLGAKPSIKTLTNSVFINFGGNLVLPRLGEVSRCVFISRKENISFSKVFGTLLSERIVDSILVILMVIIGFFTMNDIYMDFLENHVHIHIPFRKWFTSPEFYLLIGFLYLAGYIIYKKTRHPRLALKIRVFLRELVIGIKTFTILPHKWRFTYLSIAIWICYFMQLYLCFFALDFTSHLNIRIALAMFVMGNIAFALPVQGGIGPWHFMVISTMIFYGIEPTHAAAFALVAHTLMTLINALLAIYALIFSGTKDVKTNN